MEIKICIGSACHLKGSYEVIKRCKAYIALHNLESCIELKSSFCLGKCADAVSVQVDLGQIESVSPEQVECFMENIKKQVLK